MPTFSQNPHIDYWPVGTSLQPNNEFVNGSTANYSMFPPGNNVLSSGMDRAPGALTAGSAEIVSTNAAADAGHEIYPGGTYPPFISTDRIFFEAWVKLVGTTGSVTSSSVVLGARLYSAANSYVAGVTVQTRAITAGEGWVRVWGTATGASFIGSYATAARVLTGVQMNGTAASGATRTWRVGKVNTYVVPAATTQLNMVAAGALVSQAMPYTAAESPTTIEMREAVDLGAGGGPISVA